MAERRESFQEIKARLIAERAAQAESAPAATQVEPPEVAASAVPEVAAEKPPAPSSTAPLWPPPPKVIVWLVILGILFAGYLYSKVSGDDDPGSGTASLTGSAIAASEELVEDLLKAPATADFGGLADTSVTTSGTRYTVRSTVDSENSFGALIRSNYTCIVNYSTAREVWTLVSVTGLN